MYLTLHGRSAPFLVFSRVRACEHRNERTLWIHLCAKKIYKGTPFARASLAFTSVARQHELHIMNGASLGWFVVGHTCRL